MLEGGFYVAEKKESRPRVHFVLMPYRYPQGMGRIKYYFSWPFFFLLFLRARFIVPARHRVDTLLNNCSKRCGQLRANSTPIALRATFSNPNRWATIRSFFHLYRIIRTINNTLGFCEKRPRAIGRRVMINSWIIAISSRSPTVYVS